MDDIKLCVNTWDGKLASEGAIWGQLQIMNVPNWMARYATRAEMEKEIDRTLEHLKRQVMLQLRL